MIHLYHLLPGKIQLMFLGILLFCSNLVLAAPPADLDLKLVTSVSGSPLAVRHAGDGSGRILIVERSGKIYIHDGSQLLPTPFLDIQTSVTSGGEKGLLGLAFHPDFSGNRYFYVNYTYTIDTDKLYTRVSRFEVTTDNPNLADPETEQVLLEVEQPYGNHNGGDIHFGPDGYLYIGMGDGGSGGDPQDNARDLGTLLGKMLRIDVDGSSPGNGACGLVGNYRIPGSNPYKGNDGACDEIWAYGLRNPWRWSFDRSTGDLIIGDVGQRDWEEVDFQPSSSTGGEYYGWSCMEGTHEYDASRCDGSPMVAPILEYAHADGGCSITGGYRYRGPIPGMRGLYFYADYCTGNIWYAEPNDGNWSAVLWRASGLNVSSFGEDEAGNLYVVDLNGGIYRFESVTSANGCSEANETVNGTVYAGEAFICIASESIQVEDFTVMDAGHALLQAQEVFFFTDQLNQVTVEHGGTLTISQ
jgi:glucose/arabinose dehydrogenase